MTYLITQLKDLGERAKGRHNSDQVALSNLVSDNLSTITQALEAQEWRPIESAPKDGTRIFVIGLPPLWKGYPFVVHWDPKHENGCGWWRHTEPSLDALYCVSDSITHWRPLPPSPENPHD